MTTAHVTGKHDSSAVPLRQPVIDLPTSVNAWLPDRRLDQLLWGFIALGIFARLLRYILCFPLWEDECFLNYNLIERDYLGLLRPLDYHQVAPILFLWAQLTIVKLLGYSEYTLRLIPFVCSIASLLLFRHVAGRLVRGVPLLIAVAVFAVAYPNIRYAAEAKPYGCDLFVSLSLVALAVHWWTRAEESRWLWLLAALAPLAIGFSYPALFSAGGVCLFVLLAIWQLGRWRHLPGWMAYGASVVVSFCVYYQFVIRVQSAAEDRFMTNCWDSTFPPLQPLQLINWLWWTHTSDLMSYPLGGGRGAGTLPFLLCAIALVFLLRARRFGLVALLLSPLMLNFVAAGMHKYPYGGHMRFALYSAFVFCLLSALGASILLVGLDRWKTASARAFFVAVLIFELAVGAGCIARDIMHPYKTASDQQARDFARWFWFNAPINGELVCVHRDLGKHFLDRPGDELTWKAMYLCNQQIYSPRHATSQPPRWERISDCWPLRCVVYHAPHLSQFRRHEFEHWLDDMQRDYKLVGEEEFPMTRFAKPENVLISVDYVYVFKFLPRKPQPATVAEHLQRSPQLR